MRRQRRLAGLVGLGIAGALAAGLLWALPPLDPTAELPDPLPAGVVSVSESVDLGMGCWHLTRAPSASSPARSGGSRSVWSTPTRPRTRATCRGPTPRPRCATTPAPRIFLWVVPRETTTAALQAEGGGHIPAEIYHLTDLDMSVAIARFYPQDPTGWEHTATNGSGEITQRPGLLRWSEVPSGT